MDATNTPTGGDELLRAALDVAELGTWVWEVGGDATWSARTCEVFGIPYQPCVAYDEYRALLAPEDRDRVERCIERAVETGEAYAIDHRVVSPDGTERFVNARGRVVADLDGRPIRIEGVVQDITDRVATERQLRAAVEVEREVARRLRAVDELKSNILSAVSHELRTPLTAVQGFAILLQDRLEELDLDCRRQVVDHLVAEAERLERLLTDLLDIDRLRRGIIKPKLERVDVGQLVREIVDAYDDDAVEVDVDEVACCVDPAKVERIVENLLANARKHAGARVWVRVRGLGRDRERDRGVELCVEDDGDGVPAELREEIFEPFNRGDHELGHAPGTGIGLSLVAQFARLHGGRAWVEERPGGGARFVVQLRGERVPPVPADV